MLQEVSKKKVNSTSVCLSFQTVIPESPLDSNQEPFQIYTEALLPNETYVKREKY